MQNGYETVIHSVYKYKMELTVLLFRMALGSVKEIFWEIRNWDL